MKKFLILIKNNFIPHIGNNHSPHFLRNESIFFFFTLVIIIELGFLVQVFVVFDKTKFLASVLPAVLTTLTNEERSSNNAPSLRQNVLLEQAAQLKANDMASRGYFAHNTPDGKTPWYWLDQVGYKYKYAGENLAINFFESKDVAEAWMNSPSHRANIIKKEYTEIGIAVSNGIYQNKNTVFVVQFFGTPVKSTTQNLITKPIVSSVKNVQENTTTQTTTPKSVSLENKVLSEEISSIEEIVLEEDISSITPISEKTSLKSILDKILTSPRTSITYIYKFIMFLFVLILLIFLIKAEIKHPIIILKGLILVAVIVFLMFLNMWISEKHTLVPINKTEINSIAF